MFVPLAKDLLGWHEEQISVFFSVAGLEVSELSHRTCEETCHGEMTFFVISLTPPPLLS